MKSPQPLYGRRNPSTGIGSTPDRFSYSPSSSYSEASTVRKTAKNTVAVVARSVAGVFVACFTPPETTSSKSFVDSREFKTTTTVLSDASRTSSTRSRGSSRGVYANSYNSTHSREPGNSLYDKHLGVEFQSEIRTLAQVEHLNLVKLYGYLEYRDERIVIVEYVPNGTLREHLDCAHGNILDLAARLDIAIDVAHAITYLHMYTDHPIIHRDIKSSNILLTENFRAKVTDFGFARLAADTDSGATHVSTQVKGTAGYLDPEYLRTYQLTEKSDVYSFGVLLVELVSGRRPIEPRRELKERITAKWAMNMFTDGDAISTLDPKLEQTDANNLALEKVLELALQCLAPRRQNRPGMRRCAEILWSIRKDYRELSASDIRLLPSYSQRSASIKEK
ncbi:hypothetical protein Pint_00461 [Pistacia integerrima]|uniref:Uncharacterized protein n=1 Tax=Pistacia integerrima TaxID=434235 RepID=A0ACC0ZN67_9ROSI|nr:hypothetical protein Pint_00461 [Pistacia integerrima]